MTNLTQKEQLIWFETISSGQVIKHQLSAPIHVFIYKMRNNSASDPYNSANLEFVFDLSPQQPVYKAPIFPRRTHVKCNVSLGENRLMLTVDFYTAERMKGSATFRVDYAIHNPYNAIQHSDILASLRQMCVDIVQESARRISYEHIKEHTVQKMVLGLQAQTETLGIVINRCSVNDVIQWEGVAKQIVDENTVGRISRDVDLELERERAKHDLEMEKLRAEREQLQQQIRTERDAQELLLRVQKLRAMGINDPDLMMRALAEHDPDLRIILQQLDSERSEEQAQVQEHYDRMRVMFQDSSMPEAVRLNIVKEFINQSRNTLRSQEQRPPRQAFTNDAFTYQRVQEHPLPRLQQPQPLSQPQLTAPGAMLRWEDQHYSLQPTQTCIGRSTDNQIILSDPGVSRHHAEIHWQNGRYYLRDMNSSSGTIVPRYGHQSVFPQQPIELQHGDTIILGNIELQFINGGSQQTMSSPYGGNDPTRLE